MLELCGNETKINILEKVISGKGVTTEITEKFNFEQEFRQEWIVSKLFYLGFLTIISNKGDIQH